MRFPFASHVVVSLFGLSAFFAGCTTNNNYYDSEGGAGGQAGTPAAHSGSGGSASGAPGSSGAANGSAAGSPGAAAGSMNTDGGTSSGGAGGGAPAGAGAGGAIAGTPVDHDKATIYCAFPEIYSPGGKLTAITADLQRIKQLGFSTLYLLPITPRMKMAYPPHTWVNSPYSVSDYKAIDPAVGSDADLKDLVNQAHGLGMQVLLDEVLNHTAWDNALIQSHPEYYVHSDGNPKNSDSIVEPEGFPDTAQLDYKTAGNGLAAYMEDMLLYWVKTFDVDGFRFDTADNPYGPMRKITLDFWKELRQKLLAQKPGLFLLGESEDPELTAVVFDADYGWKVWGQYATGLQQVAKDGADAMSNMKAALAVQAPGQMTGFLPATRHMTLTQTWDADVDLEIFGGAPNTMAAAVFNFTFTGLPMISAGEEVGNDKGEYNSHTAVNWASSNAALFTPFYKSLLALRNANSALQQGDFAWLDNSSAQHVVSFSRSDASAKFIVVINFSGSQATGTLTSPPSGTWLDVSPSGSPGGTTHTAPPNFSLKAYDFAVFRSK